jgi:hypothetical protein
MVGGEKMKQMLFRRWLSRRLQRLIGGRIWLGARALFNAIPSEDCLEVICILKLRDYGSGTPDEALDMKRWIAEWCRAATEAEQQS